MMEFNDYSAAIILEKGGELEQRIARLAEKRGVPFQEALDSVVCLGIYQHIARNLDTYERVYQITT